MKDTSIFDFIQTDDSTYYGVLDHTTTKHHAIYDLTHNENPEIVSMIVMWRLFASEIRFAVFHSIYFPDVELDSPKLISRRKVVSNEFAVASPLDPGSIG